MLHRLAPLALLVMLLTPAAAWATAQSPAGDATYTVTDVQVEASAADIGQARERAFATGQRVAFGRLLERLGVSTAQLDVSRLSDAEMARVLQSFQVNQERTSPGRYVATLTYAFIPGRVRALLQDRGIATADTAARPAAAAPAGRPLRGPVLVLPVYRTAGTARLWDSPNPWMEAWLDYHGAEHQVTVVVPFGELADLADIDAERALAGEAAGLRAIASRYGAGEVLVAVAEPRGDRVEVTLNRYSPDVASGTMSFAVAGTPSAPGGTAYRDAVAQVATRLQGEWPASPGAAATAPSATPAPAPVSFGAGQSTVAVLVPLTGAQDWYQVQSRLARVTSIVRTNIVSLSPREAVLSIVYAGNEDQLRAALAQQSLTLQQGTAALELRRSN